MKIEGCSDNQVIQLQEYVELLIEWNQKINLISRKDEVNVWPRHILHSLSLLFFFKLKSNSHAIDIGTGGGLPGIPLAIVEPSIKFVLVDSIRKKCMAVTDMVDRLKLKNVIVVTERVEELSKKNIYQRSFDYILARAVAPTENLIEWSLPLLKFNDCNNVDKESDSAEKKMIETRSFVLWKGGNLEKELQVAQNKFHTKKISIHPISFGDLNNEQDADKKLIIINI
ncbi:MAG: 16S rRNA (guanine(527)-N(7))-methyltransferase RsmG [Ignavibacteriales bacterium]|nr:16S rRNA (guanine(527)-N(7))-methyltransferase RsmG [Ignavibacteriales bacterium]